MICLVLLQVEGLIQHFALLIRVDMVVDDTFTRYQNQEGPSLHSSVRVAIDRYEE